MSRISEDLRTNIEKMDDEVLELFKNEINKLYSLSRIK